MSSTQTGSSAQGSSQSGGSSNAGFAVGAAIFSELTQAYAAFHAARLAQGHAKAQASAMEHRSRMLQLDYRAAEERAQNILESGRADVSFLGLEAAQRRAAITASTAARGVTAGVGSAAEVQVSERLIQQIEAYNITLDSVRAANAARRQATALQNEALFARTSARNMRRMARAAAPETHLVTGVANAVLSGYSAAQGG